MLFKPAWCPGIWPIHAPTGGTDLFSLVFPNFWLDQACDHFHIQYPKLQVFLWLDSGQRKNTSEAMVMWLNTSTSAAFHPTFHFGKRGAMYFVFRQDKIINGLSTCELRALKGEHCLPLITRQVNIVKRSSPFCHGKWHFFDWVSCSCSHAAEFYGIWQANFHTSGIVVNHSLLKKLGWLILNPSRTQ